MKEKLTKLNKIYYMITFVMLFALLAFGGNTFAQAKKAKECPDKIKTSKKFKKKNIKTKPTRVKTISNLRILNKANYNYQFNFKDNGYTEKSINVHNKVYISLCVLRGNVKINGWNRDEARVFVKGNDRSPVSFKVRDRSTKDNTPVWVQVVGYKAKEIVGKADNTCLSGDIELDVPVNATVKIKNTKGQSETSIDSVRVAHVEVLGGDIYLNNISDRITASTYQGSVTVRNSSGKMLLSTTTGNIVAHNTHSNDIGDNLKAKTRSGAITLQSVDQKEVDSSSNTGSINYVGTIKPFGRYSFSTTNGSINLAIPKETSCQLVMSYGGSFQSELPLQNLFKERSGSLVYLKGQMGKGEANLSLKSFNGTIRIREKKESVLAWF